MALKGDDGLVKMYAMVNVEQYQIVETGQTPVSYTHLANGCDSKEYVVLIEHG